MGVGVRGSPWRTGEDWWSGRVNRGARLRGSERERARERERESEVEWRSEKLSSLMLPRRIVGKDGLIPLWDVGGGVRHSIG